MRRIRVGGAVAALTLCVVVAGTATAAAQNVAIQKRCIGNVSGQPTARVGDAFTCTITVVRTFPGGPDFRVDGVFDVVHHGSGDAGSGNLLTAPAFLTKKGSAVTAVHADVVAAGDSDPLRDSAAALLVDLGTGTSFLITVDSQIDVVGCLPGDSCDDGNPCTVDACDATNACVHPVGNAGVRCRQAAGPCDAEERCTGTSAACPADAFLPSTTVCRAVVASCDIAETCSGSGPACPPDRFASAGAVCRSAAGACDIAETCPGTSPTCPADRFVSAGTACRSATGECDLPETCSGTAGACPADAKRPAGTSCTADANPCTTDRCDGLNSTCQHPAGNPGAVCRPPVGECDRAETCNGTGTTCPPDSLQPAGAACPDDGNPCTDDQCNGAGSCLHPDNTAPCSDGLFCNGPDTCHNGTCSGHAGDPCAAGAECARICDDIADTCFAAAGTTCADDGNLCTRDQCDGSGACVHPPGNAGTVCRPAAGPCDRPETCTGTSATCPANASQPPGTPCADDGNPCTDDQCNGAGSCVHSHNTAPCTDGLFCNGADTCRNGTCSVHAGDPCLNGAECARTCDEAADTCFTPARSPCTDDGNVCTDDQCDGSGGCVHPNNTAPCTDGLFCNGVDTCGAGACSVHAGDPCPAGPECARTCDEAADSCAAHAGTACTDDGNPCTTDTCDGSLTCRHSPGNAGAVCRPPADDCDAAERCDGMQDACPPDALVGVGTLCRASAGDCDPSERCDGEHAACPADAKSTAVCRPAAGPCDLPESCDGTSASCPPDSVAGAPVVCRPALGACDAAEHCDGRQVHCPPDLHAGADIVCRPPADVCDAPEHCTGIDAGCPPDARAQPGSACPDDGKPCTTDTCDGNDVTCHHTPGHAGLICRPAAGACDVAEACDGTTPDCPADGFLGVNVVCRAAANECDVAERCDDSHPGCPVDAKQPDGAACDDRSACTRSDSCRAGTCAGGAPVVCGPSDVCRLAGTCDPATGTCSTPLAPTGSPCDDGDTCTTSDSCDAGLCIGTRVAGCCGVDGDCDDGFACTEDRCLDRSCVHVPMDTRCGTGTECAAPVCDPTAPGAAPSGCAQGLVDGGPYCTDDGNPCTQDTCVAGVCAHVPDGSGAGCAVLNGPFQTAAELLGRVSALALVVGRAVSTDCVAIGDPPGCEVVTGPRGPGSRLVSLVDAVQRDAQLVVVALGGRLANTGPAGTLQDPTVRVQFALTVLVDTPNNLRAFVATVGQGRNQHQVSPAFARGRRADGKSLRAATERLRRQLRRLLAQHSTFVR